MKDISTKTWKDYSSLRAAIGGLQKTSENPHFKNTYVELNAVIEAVDDVIGKHNFITYVQTAFHKDGKNFLKTQLIHDSGEIIETDLELITTKNDPQMMGSSLTYMRRYGLMTILGLRAEDDDGNMGSGKLKPASDADFNQAKKRMEKAKFAHSFKTFIDQFQKEKVYNSAQVELLGQFYDNGYKKIEEEKAKSSEVEETAAEDKKSLTPALITKAKDAMKKKNFEGSFEQYMDHLRTVYVVTPEEENDFKDYFLKESQKVALNSRETAYKDQEFDPMDDARRSRI